MTKVITISIDKKVADELQKILDITEGYYEDCDPDGVIETFTADFGDGIEADINVCNGDTPYVDPVLFSYGNQVSGMDVGETLLGRYHFPYNGNDYIVYVEAK
jgi:hypothetical protein